MFLANNYKRGENPKLFPCLILAGTTFIAGYSLKSCTANSQKIHQQPPYHQHQSNKTNQTSQTNYKNLDKRLQQIENQKQQPLKKKNLKALEDFIETEQINHLNLNTRTENYLGA